MEPASSREGEQAPSAEIVSDECADKAARQQRSEGRKAKEQQCGWCKEDRATLTCSRCKRVSYCNRDCQVTSLNQLRTLDALGLMESPGAFLSSPCSSSRSQLCMKTAHSHTHALCPEISLEERPQTSVWRHGRLGFLIRES
eukprot:m.169674 g.169674  ORF g.169674 m.169674 type:complete len:142 (-) comp14781_c0_seq4:6426-6851(-)